MRHLLCWLLGWAVMGMTDANYASKLETAIAAPTNTTDRLWWAAAHAETNTTRQRLSISPKAWLFGADNRHRPKKMRVALLMAGNVRTHDQCAPSIRKHLLEHKYNDRWRFEVVALAYEERFGHAIHKDAVSKTWKPGEVVKDVDIRKHYLAWPCHVKIVTAESVEKSIKKTPSSPMFTRFTYMFRMLRDTYMFMDSLGPFDGVVRFRFDLKLLAPFKLHNFECANCVVVPGRMQPGPAAMALGTNCGGDRLWVQDHVAYGGRNAMRAYYVDTYEKYDRGGRPPRQHSVEAHLASVLKEKGVAVKCDTSIKYTIVR